MRTVNVKKQAISMLNFLKLLFYISLYTNYGKFILAHFSALSILAP